jgi:ABC-type Mn2+/Zn2+ transport system permease subunit
VVGGLWIAWVLNLPSGAAIVLLGAVLFFAAAAWSRLVGRA